MIDIKIPWPDWKAIRKIGNGSYGSVYEIEREDQFGHMEKAALKVISIPKEESDIDSLAADGYDDESITEYYRTSLNSILDEYSLMIRLKGHPNIVSVDDRIATQQENGIGWDVYIRMELLTPFVISIKGKEFSEREVIKLGKDLLNAIKACHSYNIIHRDIKPENIFVTKFGDYKLGDFGVARIMSHTTNATKTGTPYYMAPEVDNNEKYGKEADIYSLGMVLYWLLNNRRLPFEPVDHLPSAVEKEKAYKTRLSGKEIPETLNGSTGLKRVIRKALAYNPKNRYKTAEEMLSAIENAQNNASTELKLKTDLDIKSMTEKVARPGNSKIETSRSKPSDKSVSHSETIGNSWGMGSETIGPSSRQKTERDNSGSISDDHYTKTQGAYSSVREKPEIDNRSTTVSSSDSPIRRVVSKSGDPEFVIYEDRLFFYQGNKRSVVIPSTVKAIQNNAFKDCTSLRKVTIPKGIRTIPVGAFDGCVNLEKVILPEGLESIDKYAFRDCIKLKHIVLPLSIEWIADEAFDGKYGLDYTEMFSKLVGSNKAVRIESPGLALAYNLERKEGRSVKQTKNQNEETRKLLIIYFIGWVMYILFGCYRYYIQHAIKEENLNFGLCFGSVFIIVGLIKPYFDKKEGGIYVLGNLAYGLGYFYLVFMLIAAVVLAVINVLHSV